MNLAPKRIAQLGRVVTGKTPPTARQEFFGGEYLFVTPTDLEYDHYYCRSTERTVTEEAKNALSNQFIPADAVMFTCIGATIGKCGIAPAECLTNQQINSVVANEQTDSKFLYYLLCHNVDVVKGLGGGAATPIVSKSKFAEVEFLVPPFHDQQAISAILSAYDDLIENNRRRMALLEEAARQLYREWFVRLRFPGHEHTRIINGVPEGWERVQLFDIAYPTYGYPFQSPLFTEDGEGLPVVRIRDVLAGESKTFTLEEAPPDRRLQDGDMLIGMDGNFHMGLWAGGDAWLNQRVVRIKSKGSVDDYLLFNLLRGPISALNETITGTTVVHLGAKELKEIRILVPPHALLIQADEWFAPIGKQLVALKLLNRQLRAARDLLLPRLMSGAIAV